MKEVLLEAVSVLNLLKSETSDIYVIILCLLEGVKFVLHFADSCGKAFRFESLKLSVLLSFDLYQNN